MSGEIDYRADEDWFRFRASASRSYDLTLTLGHRHADEPIAAADQARVRVFSTANELLFESAVLAGRSSTTLDFQPTDSGQLYFQVTNPMKGVYDLTIDSDDHGDDRHKRAISRYWH